MSRCGGLAATLALVFAARTGAELRLPPPPKAYFNDDAGFVSADVARRLDETLRRFDQETGNQVVVAILPKLPSSSLEDFTVRTAQAWRVGRKELDNGAVLFVFVQDRKLRLEVGYGLEDKIPDAIAKRIVDDVIVPRFRAGDPAGGLEAGIEAILSAARGNERVGASVALARPGKRSTGPVRASRGLSKTFWTLTVVGLVVLFGNVVSSRHKGTALSGSGCLGTLAGYGGFGVLLWQQDVDSDTKLLVFFLGGFVVLIVVAIAYVIRSGGTTGVPGGGWNAGSEWSSSGWSSGSSGSGSSGGGFSGGGGSFGGGGASGSW